MPRKYPQSFKDRAVRMVFDRLEDEDAPSRYTVIRQTAPKLSIAVETLLGCVKFFGQVAWVFFLVTPLWLMPLRRGLRGRSRLGPGCGNRGWNGVAGGCKTLRCIRPLPCVPGPGWQRPVGGTFRFSSWRKTSRPRRCPSTRQCVPSIG